MDVAVSKPELTELLQEVKQRNIQLSLDEGAIRYRGPRFLVDVPIKERIKTHRRDLEQFLLQQPSRSFPNVEIRNAAVDKYCIIQIQTGKHRCGLFCLHSVTGLASLYRHIAPGLGADYSIFGINAVDSDLKRPPIAGLNAMARYYADQIQLVQDRGPYFICGLSMGGLIALEVARILGEREEQVDLLAMLDTRLPNRDLGTMPDELDKQPAWAWLNFIAIRISNDIVKQYENDRVFWRMSLREKCEHLSADALRYNPGLFGGNATSEVIGKRFSSFVALLKSHQRYQPGEYHGKIVYFVAEDEQAHDGTFPYLAQWPEVAKGEFEVVSTPGDHASMIFNEENGLILGRKLRAYLP